MAFFSDLGVGIGLRPPHYPAACAGEVGVDWFEAITDNFLAPGGNPRRVLRAVRERYPIALHGVSLSLGSVDPLDTTYLNSVATLAEEFDPAWISEHVCWSSFAGHHVHDLWPLPYTEEALSHVAARIIQTQELLGRQILVENVSSYFQFSHSTMSEWEFLSELATRADCGLLVDINNVYVSAQNHQFDARVYLNALPATRVGQIHLAGHQRRESHLLDTHDHPVCDDVWTLYREFSARVGAVSTLIEWDDALPPISRLVEEADTARAVRAAALDDNERKTK